MADIVKFLRGTQAEYNALQTKRSNYFYIITDVPAIYLGSTKLTAPSYDDITVKLDKSVAADVYNSAKTYAVGDVCIYANSLYKCKTTITTAENWNSSHWTAKTINDIIKESITERKQFEIDSSGYICANYDNI